MNTESNLFGIEFGLGFLHQSFSTLHSLSPEENINVENLQPPRAEICVIRIAWEIMIQFNKMRKKKNDVKKPFLW